MHWNLNEKYSNKCFQRNFINLQNQIKLNLIISQPCKDTKETKLEKFFNKGRKKYIYRKRKRKEK